MFYKWLPVPEYKNFLRSRSSGLVSSQLSEDCFHLMKNNGMVKGAKRKRKVQKCMSSMLTTKVASTRHKFKEVVASKRAGQQQLFPGPEVFIPVRNSSALPLRDMVSTSQTNRILFSWRRKLVSQGG